MIVLLEPILPVYLSAKYHETFRGSGSFSCNYLSTFVPVFEAQHKQDRRNQIKAKTNQSVCRMKQRLLKNVASDETRFECYSLAPRWPLASLYENISPAASGRFVSICRNNLCPCRLTDILLSSLMYIKIPEISSLQVE